MVEGALSAVAGASQRLYAALARRRHAAAFAEVERFLLFVGYPRSGHSLVGAMLDAHPHAVVSHELDAAPMIAAGCARDELYAAILARSWWFALRGNRSNYDYRIPGGSQGRFESLRVIGDKRGGAVTRALAGDPAFLERVRVLVQAPLRLVHVVRNPYDTIAAISIWHGLSLEDSATFYFDHCRTTRRLDELCEPGELVTLRHEELVAEPRRTVVRLCETVGLEPFPAYVDACARVVWPRPTQTRARVDWTPALLAEVERQAAGQPFLAGYAFEPRP